ncbi:MAG TPA: AAA family ATPase [Candidatus Eisenbacteria bacterium]|nr:AAA family ATPase [Candidatus Eisenbacteria bacterium]
MKRALVLGSGGSGKTTFAVRLARLTGLPLIHLDSHYWLPNWQKRSDDEWASIVRELVSRDCWIMDGNYGGTLDERLKACDTVFFLDVPRGQCLSRVLRRQLLNGGRARAEMPEGCAERFSLEFLAWIWTYPTRRRGPILERLEGLRSDRLVHVFRSDAEIDHFLDRLR